MRLWIISSACILRVQALPQLSALQHTASSLYPVYLPPVSMLQRQHAEPTSKKRKYSPCLYRDATIVKFIVDSKKDCYTAISEVISAHSDVCPACLYDV